MPYALTPPEDDLSPRRALATDLLLGGAVGTLLGLLVGLSGSTAVTAIAAAATALAGSVVVLRGSERAVRPLRAGALAVAAIGSLLLGTWLERHDALGPTPKEMVAQWQKAGLSKRDAQIVVSEKYTGGKVDLPPPSPAAQVKSLMRAGLTRPQALAHLGLDQATDGKKKKKRRTEAEYCEALERRDYKPERELRSWKRRGGEWAEAAKWVEGHVSCQSRAEAVRRVRKLACAGK